MKQTLKNLAQKVVDNKAVIIRNTVIIAGAVVGLVLAAGITAKITDAALDELETAPEA